MERIVSFEPESNQAYALPPTAKAGGLPPVTAVTGPKVRMVGVLVEAEHQIAVRFDPVDAVVFVVDASRAPEANLQLCGRRVVQVTQERRRIDIRDDVPGSASRRAIADRFTEKTRRMPRGLTPWRKPTLNDANNVQQQGRLPHYNINIH